MWKGNPYLSKKETSFSLHDSWNSGHSVLSSTSPAYWWDRASTQFPAEPRASNPYEDCMIVRTCFQQWEAKKTGALLADVSLLKQTAYTRVHIHINMYL